MKKINITDFPISINYGGDVYFLSVYVTAWNKLCFAYRNAFDKGVTILSEVVENENSVPYNTEDVSEIVDVPNFGTALYVAYSRLVEAIDNGIITIHQM